jgi:hypothetical protein
MIEAKLSKSGKTLTITKDGVEFYYDIEDLQPDTRVARKAFRLTKDDGIFWDVHLDEWGVGCTCGDCVFSNGQECKHIWGLRDRGLLPKARKQ